ncbi:ABC transporter ATP-binding protein [Geodermatophilaceae bacterium NBWT11]|nr:ABC transporter ATP-binding protein [Geodermatophilaceae bacterium NBWT11]
MTAVLAGEPLVVCESLVRIHRTGSVEVQALQGLDLVVDPGEVLAVVGASGSGKSTLLAVLAGIDAPTAGRVTVGPWDLTGLSRRDRVAYRREVVGFVWQQTARNLVPYLTATENVVLPLALAGTPKGTRAARAAELLELVGVAHVADRRPAACSGGEQQRVAIAVGLANAPALLLADEPTGELDTTSSQQVYEALRTVNRDLGTTVVVVTHDPTVSDQVERTVAIRDGRTASEVLRRTQGEDTVAEEFAVLDRAGRMQLPAEYRTALDLTRRVRLTLEADHVAVHRDGGA